MTDLSKIVDVSAQLGKIDQGLRLSPPETAHDKVRKSIERSLGTSLEAYQASYKRLKDSFGTNGLSEEIAKVGRTLGNQSRGVMYDNYLELNDPIRHLDVMPPLAANPISETNQHLESLIGKMEYLYDVQARQADIVDKLLNAFVEGSVSQEKAAKANLRVAWISAALAGVAVVVTVLTAFPIF